MGIKHSIEKNGLSLLGDYSIDNTSTGFFLKVFVYFCALAVNCSYMLFLGSFLPAMNWCGCSISRCWQCIHMKRSSMISVSAISHLISFLQSAFLCVPEQHRKQSPCSRSIFLRSSIGFNLNTLQSLTLCLTPGPL